MAATVVQRKSAHTAVSSTTAAVSSLSATGSGRLMVVAVSSPLGGVTVTNVTDNIGNVYTQAAGAAAVDAFFDSRADIWYCLNAASGVTTITATFSGATDNKFVMAWEVSGMTSPALDDADHVDDGTAQTVTGPTLTGSGTDHFAVGIVASASGISENPATGNEFDDAGDSTDRSPDWDSAGCALITATPGSHTPVWTAGAIGHWCVSAAIFKSGGAAVPNLPTPPIQMERPFQFQRGRM